MSEIHHEHPVEGDLITRPGYAPAPRRRRGPSLFWPILFIAVGVLLLFSNLGYLPEPSWELLWRFWPVILIALGMDVLFGRRSLGGAIFSGVLIALLIGTALFVVFFAQNIPWMVNIATPGLRSETVSHPLGEVRSADLTIDWSAFPGALSALEDSGNLIEADLDYLGELDFDVQLAGAQADVTLDTWTNQWWGPWQGNQAGAHWDVTLNPSVLWALDIDASSGSCTLDLSELQVSELTLDVGSGAVALTLPAESSFTAAIDGGSGALTLSIPPTVGVRVELESGSGSFNPDARFTPHGNADDEPVWETENYGSVAYNIILKIDQGSGSITLR